MAAPTNLSTVVHVCEDTNQTFDLVALLTQAGYPPEGSVRVDRIQIRHPDGTVSAAPADLLSAAADGSGIIVTAANRPDWNGSSGPLEVLIASGDQVFPITLAVVVDPVNDAPEGTDATIGLTGVLRHVLKEADFGFRDLLDGDAFKSVVVRTLPQIGYLELNGSSISADTEISLDDIRAGLLLYHPSASGIGASSFDFQVRDTGGTAGCGAVDLDGTPNRITFDLPLLNQVSGRIWNDANGNGVQDAGESSRANHYVWLTSAGPDGEFGTLDEWWEGVYTDANGAYRFAGLAADQYRIAVRAEQGQVLTVQDAGGDDTIDSDVDRVTGESAIFTLGEGLSHATVDAGVLPDTYSARVGSRVWLDVNGNGVQDEGEPGVPGMEVTLRSGASNFSTTRVTDSEGHYQFDRVEAGHYTMVFSGLSGYAFTATDAGGDDALDSDVDYGGRPPGFYLAAGEQNLSIDAGVTPLVLGEGSIGDRVWHDINGNGVQDDGEAGLANVSVVLRKGLIPWQSTQTDANGHYQFSGLAAGGYRVAFGRLPGAVFTAANAGDDANDSDADGAGLSHFFMLGEGQSLMNVDAGLILTDPKTARIGDRVWLDANDNGVQDSGEVGLAGVKVLLYSYASTSYIQTTTSGAEGQYSFTGLAAGTYQVAFEEKAGYRFSAGTGFDDTTDSDAGSGGGTGLIVLTAGQANDTVDAGLVFEHVADASVGNRVWNDLNGNGLQDAGEPGVANVQVQLRSYTDVLATTQTDANGEYSFGGLVGGPYRLWFNGLPQGYGFTKANAGDDALDSDVDVSGLSFPFYLSSGQSDMSMDAGVKLADSRTASIGDRVWLDADHDGVQDSGEAGVADLAVELFRVDSAGNYGEGTYFATTTDDAGQYRFTGLAAGQYQVTFGGLAGHTFTAAQVGDDASDSDADSAGKSHVITLAEGQSEQSVDAGLIKNICASIVSTAGATGTVSMDEGTQQSFKVQLDGIVSQDTQFWVQIDDGSAHRTHFNASSQIVHADPRKLSTDFSLTNAGRHQSSAHKAFGVRGPSDMSWDFGVVDTAGNIMGAATGFWVTVKAGASSSATFSVNAWNEFVDVDRNGSNTYGTKAFSSAELQNQVWLEAATEHFTLTLTQNATPGMVVCDPTTTVTITDRSKYDVTSPIILDLDGNGVQTTALDASAGVFDLLGNGKAVASGWASSGDGFLAIDVNGNGKIDDVGELFGGRVGEGFAKLSGFDSNGDGVVNAADADFDKLLVWQDANGNRQTDAGELRTLGEASIASLNTDNWFQNVEQNGNVLGETSTATRTDGSSIEMIDVYFKYEELPALDSLVEADNALFDSVLGGGSAREMPAIADIAFDAAGEAQRVIAEAMKQADASLAVAV